VSRITLMLIFIHLIYSKILELMAEYSLNNCRNITYNDQYFGAYNSTEEPFPILVAVYQKVSNFQRRIAHLFIIFKNSLY